MEPQKKPIHLNENDTPYLYEPFRNQMPAKRPHPAEKEKILKPWQGLLVFAFLMVLFNLAGIPLVLAGGMYGNALDEIIVFLIGSILVVRALHIPLKEVFPLKKPDGAGILGTILMWYVTYRGVLALFLLWNGFSRRNTQASRNPWTAVWRAFPISASCLSLR